LFGCDLSALERGACRAAIPLTIVLSAFGLLCSVSTLEQRLALFGGRGAAAAAAAAAGLHGFGSAAAVAAVAAAPLVS